jgi:DNA adenine methylase
MRPPLTYYGGKQRLVKFILPKIPPHTLYVEPFLGGGAIFWNKEPSKGEVLNDVNGEIINFYQVAKTKFKLLNAEIQNTLHSRMLHRKAYLIHEFPELFSDIKTSMGCLGFVQYGL